MIHWSRTAVIAGEREPVIDRSVRQRWRAGRIG